MTPLLFALAVTIHVDTAANRHPIDPNIYGVAFATAQQLDDLNVPLNRSGGNATTRYNWQLNASNRAADWFFESIGEESGVPGEAVDSFINDTRSAGAQPMITIPTIGWTAKLGPNREKLASFSVAKYGAQQYVDPYMPDAGNGVATNGREITGNDPNDANVVVDGAFEEAWVRHLVGSVHYYLLDNEPSIWSSTHRDVHPADATKEEIAAKDLDVATRIKQVDPTALVCGPEEWGWGGYFYVPSFVQQLHGKLDVLTLHFYPQSGEFSDDTSMPMQLLRNRSTRSLWDPNYVDESWINDKVMLIPRMRTWANGLKIGITEYDWGAEHHINGATAQADVLGIFGREGLDLAARWTTPDAGTPAYNAIKIFRNYDDRKSGFGDNSVSAGGPNPDEVSAFAAVRSSDGALTIMIVNKTTSSVDATLDVANFAATTAQRWQLTASNVITRVADTGTSLALPAQSITLLVFARQAAAHHRAAQH